jgi:hypothetical protein
MGRRNGHVHPDRAQPSLVPETNDEPAQKNPDSDVLAIDLALATPMNAPPNCHFLVADALEEWRFGTKFDFIHARDLGDLSDRSGFFKSVFEHTTQGGWAQFQEWVFHLQSPDHSLDGTALETWSRTLNKGTCHPSCQADSDAN